MSQTSAVNPGFCARANDLNCRDFSARLSRFLRARIRNFCGSILLWADDPRAFIAWRRSWEADHFIRLLRWRDGGFRPRVIFDIGAHRGIWSEMAEHIFSPERIFLFEPQREYQQAAMSRRPPHAKSWEMIPTALGDTTGSTRMNVTSNTAASSLLPPVETPLVPDWGTQTVRTEEIAVSRLDDLVSNGRVPIPDLVKIDVQGYEQPVLKGGMETLRQAKRIVIEVSLQTIYKGQALLPEVLHTLSELGFALDDLNEGARPWPAPPAQVDLWLRKP